MQRLTAAILFLLFCLATFALLYNPTNNLIAVSVADITLHVETATTPTERTKGLSGRQSLGSSDGMLFFFETDDLHGFWMRDTYLSLDIIWLNADKVVVHIERNVSPDSYPTIFTPPSPARYVLEIAAGRSEQLGITTGSRFSWTN